MKLRGSLISDIFFVFATLQASLFLNTATWIKHLAVGAACYRDSMRGNRKAAAMVMCACAFASALCLQRTFFVSAPVRRAPASREVFIRPALPASTLGDLVRLALHLAVPSPALPELALSPELRLRRLDGLRVRHVEEVHVRLEPRSRARLGFLEAPRIASQRPRNPPGNRW